jgi:glucose-6-phosphate 1-epimerase
MFKMIERNGIPLIEIKNRSASALISLYGGQVISFKPVTEADDLLFLSEKSHWDGMHAIRGGIPVCWPWFGQHKTDAEAPNHGFARNSQWKIAATQEISEFKTKITLKLEHESSYSDYWPERFDLQLEVTIADTLTLDLLSRNASPKTFSFTQALHAYFRVSDIARVKVLGLEGSMYLDKLDDFTARQQHGPVLVSAEIDQIYSWNNNQLTLIDPGLRREIQINSMGSHSAIVWNPWAKKSIQIADLNAEDYKNFLCIEAANAGSDTVELKPGQLNHLRTEFRIVGIK